MHGNNLKQYWDSVQLNVRLLINFGFPVNHNISRWRPFFHYLHIRRNKARMECMVVNWKSTGSFFKLKVFLYFDMINPFLQSSEDFNFSALWPANFKGNIFFAFTESSLQQVLQSSPKFRQTKSSKNNRLFCSFWR